MFGPSSRRGAAGAARGTGLRAHEPPSRAVLQALSQAAGTTAVAAQRPTAARPSGGALCPQRNETTSTALSSPNMPAGHLREARASARPLPSGAWPHIYRGTAEGRTPGRRAGSCPTHPGGACPSAPPHIPLVPAHDDQHEAPGSHLLSDSRYESPSGRDGAERQGRGSETGRGSGRVGHGVDTPHWLQAAAARPPRYSTLPGSLGFLPGTSRPTLMSHSGRTCELLTASPDERLVGSHVHTSQAWGTWLWDPASMEGGSGF